MLFTIFSYFDGVDKNEECLVKSPTGSIVSDTLSYSDNSYDMTREEDGWEKILTPISVEEDYELVIIPSGVPGTDDVVESTTTSNDDRSAVERETEWRHQRSLQRNQLGLSISKTFAELSKEDPNQLEEEAIQRAMELSMLDVALVHSHYRPNKQQQPLPCKILGIAENVSLMEIKTAYRKLARLHVSK